MLDLAATEPTNSVDYQLGDNIFTLGDAESSPSATVRGPDNNMRRSLGATSAWTSNTANYQVKYSLSFVSIKPSQPSESHSSKIIRLALRSVYFVVPSIYAISIVYKNAHKWLGWVLSLFMGSAQAEETANVLVAHERLPYFIPVVLFFGLVIIMGVLYLAASASSDKVKEQSSDLLKYITGYVFGLLGSKIG